MPTTTPLTAARAWAKANPDQTAILHVISYTRGGKGGWLSKRHDTTVYIKAGLAALTKGRYISGDILHGRHHNGQCEICGALHLDLVLRRVFSPDPLAGELIRERHAWETRDTRRADLAYINNACPDCIALHNLIVTNDSGHHYTDTCNYEPRPHPTLNRFPFGPTYTHRLDLRQDNPHVEALAPITVNVTSDTAPIKIILDELQWA